MNRSIAVHTSYHLRYTEKINMAHISSLGAGIFTYLDIFTGTIPADTDTSTEFAALYAGGTAGTDVLRMPSVREFPAIGTPANIVNVPVYGQKTSSQVQGQADAPSLEITVNYVAADMEAFHALIDGTTKVFRFMMASQPVTEAQGAGVATLAIDNTEFYFQGKVEAILVNPALTDATTATVTLSAQTDFVGPATVAAS
jgi:hypothetical protein